MSLVTEEESGLEEQLKNAVINQEVLQRENQELRSKLSELSRKNDEISERNIGINAQLEEVSEKYFEVMSEFKKLRESMNKTDRNASDKVERVRVDDEIDFRKNDNEKSVHGKNYKEKGARSKKLGSVKEKNLKESDASSESDENNEQVLGKKKNRTQRKDRNSLIDSLFASSDEGQFDSDWTTLSVPTKNRYHVLSEIPRVKAFDIESGQDINDWFEKFVNYAKEQYPSSKSHWVKELENVLEGRVLDYYRTCVMAMTDPKFSFVKEKIIEFVKRVKKGIKFEKKNDFQDARLKRNESIQEYAWRIDVLAFEKFGKMTEDDDKRVLKKFYNSVPGKVREWINKIRKERMQYKDERLTWKALLDEIEDCEFRDMKGSANETMDVDLGQLSDGKESGGFPIYKSYKDALMSDPVEVMAKFMNDYYQNKGKSQVKRENGNERHQARGRSHEKNRRWSERGRSASRTSNRSGNVPKCYECGKLGHMKNECWKRLGLCVACGKGGHFAKDCMNRKSECWGCGEKGHIRSECKKERKSVTWVECFRCGEKGHFDRDCKAPEPKSDSERNKVRCLRCGETGHLARVCKAPSPVSESARQQENE